VRDAEAGSAPRASWWRTGDGQGLVDAVRRISGSSADALVALSNEGQVPRRRCGRARRRIVGEGPPWSSPICRPGSCASRRWRRLPREGGERAVVCGVNLPMLLDFVFHRELPLEELVARLIERGREAITVRVRRSRMPIVLLFRVDERLIHGQVVIGWGQPAPPRSLRRGRRRARHQRVGAGSLPPGSRTGPRWSVRHPADASRAPGRVATRRHERTILLTRDVVTMRRWSRGGCSGRVGEPGGDPPRPGRDEVLNYLHLSDADRRGRGGDRRGGASRVRPAIFRTRSRRAWPTCLRK
jgi:hypothetical protein